jgi:tetratricopeptide (TPR) repeat protein
VSLKDVLAEIAVEPQPEEAPEALVDRRIDHIGRMSRNAADRCLELLVSAHEDGEHDQELLEDLVLLGLAWPRLVLRHGYELVGSARELAACRLGEGDLRMARAVLERAAELFPDHVGLERDLVAVLREADEVEELARRCIARAQREIDGGRIDEAIAWLQEVIRVDPGRRDLARLIRDLRFGQADRARRRARLRRAAAVSLLAMILVGALAWREYDVRRQFRGLPSVDPSSAASVEVRLAALEGFATTHPVWHGAFDVRSELSGLRSTRRRLESQAQTDRALAATIERERRAEADLLLAGVESKVEYGRLGLAVEDIRRALELGGVDWPSRERALADLEALERLIQQRGETRGRRQ